MKKLFLLAAASTSIHGAAYFGYVSDSDTTGNAKTTFEYNSAANFSAGTGGSFIGNTNSVIGLSFGAAIYDGQFYYGYVSDSDTTGNENSTFQYSSAANFASGSGGTFVGNTSTGIGLDFDATFYDGQFYYGYVSDSDTTGNANSTFQYSSVANLASGSGGTFVGNTSTGAGLNFDATFYDGQFYYGYVSDSDTTGNANSTFRYDSAAALATATDGVLVGNTSTGVGVHFDAAFFVPEPSSAALVSLGVFGLLASRRRV